MVGKSYHVVESELGDVLEVGGGHVQADGPVEEHGPELEEGVKGEGRYVWLGPPVPALLHVLLEFYPSGSRRIGN